MRILLKCNMQCFAPLHDSQSLTQPFPADMNIALNFLAAIQPSQWNESIWWPSCIVNMAISLHHIIHIKV